jgi:hypothetical protein
MKTALLAVALIGAALAAQARSSPQETVVDRVTVLKMCVDAQTPRAIHEGLQTERAIKARVRRLCTDALPPISLPALSDAYVDQVLPTYRVH